MLVEEVGREDAEGERDAGVKGKSYFSSSFNSNRIYKSVVSKHLVNYCEVKLRCGIA